MFNHYLFKVNYLNWATRRRSKDKINLFSPRKRTFILAFFKIFMFSYLFKVQKYEWNIREKQIVTQNKCHKVSRAVTKAWVMSRMSC